MTTSGKRASEQESIRRPGRGLLLLEGRALLELAALLAATEPDKMPGPCSPGRERPG